MKSIAIIPARGGSKRIPRKNIIDFLGRPIIAYTIDAAYESGVFERVVVSTEDKEIAEVALKSGAEVVWRSEKLAGDRVSVADVCVDFLNSEQQNGRKYGMFCCLYAASPLRSAEDIRNVCSLLGPECHFSMAVTEYYFTPLGAFKYGNDGALSLKWPELLFDPEERKKPLVVDNGSTYAAETEYFLKEKNFFGDGLFGYRMPRERSVDIDTFDDLMLAELYAKASRGLI